MPSFATPEQVVQAGDSYIKNAEDALAQKVIREDQLYIWENQLQAIDEFLADTEDFQGQGGAAAMRARARETKQKLEASIAGFFQEPVEDEDPETNVAALLEVGAGLIDEAESALKKKYDKIQAAAPLEDALIAVKQWLSDSEPYSGHKVMGAARKDMRGVKIEIERRLTELITAWKASDSGDDDDDD